MASAARELPMVDRNIIERGNVFFVQEQLLLCRLYTSNEITEALFNMGSQKAPNMDGFNVHFFKEAWLLSTLM